MPSQPKQLSFKGNVGIHRPFDKIPETGTQELFNETPVSLQATPVPQQGTGAPKQIESPVHEVPAPMKVIPGPVQVSLEQWLQIVENQQITMGEDGKAEVLTIDPRAKTQNGSLGSMEYTNGCTTGQNGIKELEKKDAFC
jgi:hypothetical protein